MRTKATTPTSEATAAVVVVDASGQYPEDLWRAVAIIFVLLLYADQEAFRVSPGSEQWGAGNKSEISFSHLLRFIKLFAAHGNPKSSCVIFCFFFFFVFCFFFLLSCRCRLHFDRPCQLPVVELVVRAAMWLWLRFIFLKKSSRIWQIIF